MGRVYHTSQRKRAAAEAAALDLSGTASANLRGAATSRPQRQVTPAIRLTYPGGEEEWGRDHGDGAEQTDRDVHLAVPGAGGGRGGAALVGRAAVEPEEGVGEVVETDEGCRQAPSAGPRPGTARAGPSANSAKAMISVPAMTWAVSITQGDRAVRAPRSLTSWLATE